MFLLSMILLATVLCAWLLGALSMNATPLPAPKPVVFPPSVPGGQPPGSGSGKRSLRMILGDLLYFGPKRECFANAGESVSPFGSTTRKADAGLVAQSRYLLVKTGTDVYHADVCGLLNMPIGVVTDEAAATDDLVGVQMLGANGGTVRMIANGVIGLDAYVYTAASGKISAAPAPGTGLVYRVGIARTAATGDGHVIEVEPMAPFQINF